jgi:predicted nucleic acid-binding protein
VDCSSGPPQGYTYEQSDALLATTAIHHSLVVITPDIKPFEQAEVAVFDPWQTH